MQPPPPPNRTPTNAVRAARTAEPDRTPARRHPRPGLRAPAEAICRYARLDVHGPASRRGRRAAGMVLLPALRAARVVRDRGRFRAGSPVLQRVRPGQVLVDRDRGERGRLVLPAPTDSRP